MQKSKIEWTTYSINPIKGLCPVDCKDNQGKSYCYARKMYDRFKWNPEIRFQPSVFNTLPKKPCTVFVGSTMELFLFDDWMEFILNRCQDFPQITFVFLTKCPENLWKWSPFPENTYVGVSVTNSVQFKEAHKHLIPPFRAGVRFLSFEPLLEHIEVPDNYWKLRIWLNECCDWVILGALTGPKAKQYKPRPEWVEEIMAAANEAEIPVFLKDNLRWPVRHREWPEENK